MKVVQRRERREAVVSLVLLDWSVRETFQLLHYLAQQTVPRPCFEVIVIEYYAREAPALAPWAAFIDTWLLLEMPARCYYHKHLMYNAGLVLAQGEVVLFCDSDAMVRDSFLSSVIAAFRAEPRQVLHLDQFRNIRRELYPFAFPSFDEVLGPGCLNNVGGRPRGLLVAEDTLHERNYGACMAAPRGELLAIGGADEHHDYLGHICGPYELTFRLGQAGVPERWHPTEFLYHTWHPGQAGAGNYLGPHDGRHMSTTALAVLTTGRTAPLVANPAVARLQAAPALPLADRLALLIAPDRADTWTVDAGAPPLDAGDVPHLVDHYRSFNIVAIGEAMFAVPSSAGPVDLATETSRRRSDVLEGACIEEIKARIDQVAGHGRVESTPLEPAAPALIVEGYRGFNIVRWSGRYYAIPQGEGAFDPDRFERGDYSRSFDRNTEQATMASIDQHSAASAPARSILRLPLALTRRVMARLQR